MLAAEVSLVKAVVAGQTGQFSGVRGKGGIIVPAIQIDELRFPDLVVLQNKRRGVSAQPTTVPWNSGHGDAWALLYGLVDVLKHLAHAEGERRADDVAELLSIEVFLRSGDARIRVCIAAGVLPQERLDFSSNFRAQRIKENGPQATAHDLVHEDEPVRERIVEGDDRDERPVKALVEHADDNEAVELAGHEHLHVLLALLLFDIPGNVPHDGRELGPIPVLPPEHLSGIDSHEGLSVRKAACLDDGHVWRAGHLTVHVHRVQRHLGDGCLHFRLLSDTTCLLLSRAICAHLAWNRSPPCKLRGEVQA
mmetsp:Transcript_20925/g.61914  ORF Transcript_20925/g.61914 Transcript_20925/m.61914 type:complete len:308 (+) Transcript_20925:442-1365(+)